MPTSKQARARQQRQMDKVALAQAARARAKRRKTIIWSVVAVVAIITLSIGAAVVQSNSDDSVNVAPPTTEATTPTTVRATPTNCTGLKDDLPKGAPAMPLEAGPAPTKLVTKDLTVGTGAEVTKTSKATVAYVGVNCSGKIFDSSYKEGAKPFEANMAENGVIQGWLQGIPGMKVGGVRLLSIPPDLAYGADARSELIPANEPLFFVVKVEKVS